MKKAFKRAGIGLALALTFAGAVEWTGYHILDRKDGSNILYEHLHDSRPLTKGEIRIAREVFGNTIDYDKVRIFNRPWMGFFGSQNRMVTPNGNIYIADKDLYGDFSEKSAYTQTLFIHEMTHVWQHQHGRAVRWDALKGFVSSGFNYESTYTYKTEDVKDFNKLNIEQQAHMVEDYYGARAEYSDFGCDDGTTNNPVCAIPESSMQELAAKIRPTLPLPGLPAPRTFAPPPPAAPTLDMSGIPLFSGPG